MREIIKQMPYVDGQLFSSVGLPDGDNIKFSFFDENTLVYNIDKYNIRFISNQYIYLYNQNNQDLFKIINIFLIYV